MENYNSNISCVIIRLAPSLFPFFISILQPKCEGAKIENKAGQGEGKK